MQTVYYASSCSDGYVVTRFYETCGVMTFHYEADEEGFGATDSEGSFTCEGFTEFTSLEEVLDSVQPCSEKELNRLLDLVEEHLCLEDQEKAATTLTDMYAEYREQFC